MVHAAFHAENEALLLPEESVAELVARAEAPRRFPDLSFRDPVAERLLASLDVDTAAYDDRRLRASLMRTMIVDALVAGFFQRQPDGLALAFRPGLCTRFDRVDNGSLHWIDLDAPPVADLKSNVLDTNPRHVRTVACSAQCSGFVDCLGGTGEIPTIIIVQSAMLRCAVEELEQFFTDASGKVGAGTELVIEYDATRPLRPSSLAKNPALELVLPDRAVARFPRLRFVGCDAYQPPLANALAGYRGVSRLFGGRTMPSLAHLRFV